VGSLTEIGTSVAEEIGCSSVTGRERHRLNRSTESVESRFSAPPCFFHRDCGATAEVEKQGKSVCRPCAGGLAGTAYPLREPSREPLYGKPEELVLQLDMKEPKRKRSRE
jgi:hypothetical protein